MTIKNPEKMLKKSQKWKLKMMQQNNLEKQKRTLENSKFRRFSL